MMDDVMDEWGYYENQRKMLLLTLAARFNSIVEQHPCFVRRFVFFRKRNPVRRRELRRAGLLYLHDMGMLQQEVLG